MREEFIKNAIEILKVKGDCLLLRHISCWRCPLSNKQNDIYATCIYTITDEDDCNRIITVDPLAITNALISYLEENNITTEELFKIFL